MPNDESIGALKERIAFHAKKTSELQSLYNTHAPIARLPPEILSEVFLIQAAVLRRDALHGFFHDEDDVLHQSLYKWIKVSHVCRHWREIALNCANLWTWVAYDQRIPISYPEMLLERARELPLTVTFIISDTMGHCEGCIDRDWFYDNFHDQTAEICFLVPRIRELLVLIDRSGFEECWEDMFSAESDVLEVLRIEAFGKSRYNQLAIPPRGPNVSITEPLFVVPPPNLRSLSFSGVGCSWSETLLRPSLRHLELTNCQILESPNAADMVAFLDALRPLSNLETLELDWPLFTDITEANCKPVSLPRLRSIHLKGSNERIGSILSCLQLPLTTSVRCTVLDSFFNERERKPFQAVLARLFEKMTINVVGWGAPLVDQTGGDITTTCQIWAVQGRGVRQQGSGLSLDAIVGTTSPRLVLQTGFRPSLDVVTPAVLQALDLSSVELIQVVGYTPSRSWARALKKAVNVQRLSISGTAAFALPAVLAGGVPEDPEEDWQICLDNDVANADEWHWTAFDEDPPPVEHMDVEEADTVEDDTAPQPDNAISGPGPAIFPKLHSLDILDVDIHLPQKPLDFLPYGECTCYPRASHTVVARFSSAGAKYGLSISKLLKCLRVREEQRASPIVHVDFEECSCGDLGLIRQLAGVVPEVFWDEELVLPLEPGP
ncbi:uncharacterized protein TRAVEDRAFT_44614 [Trametes versicolor FP-101664 SS1]|uniref:uncharacterized protein n=1 Tax=Trametes versicolor (strain FP-101664) TaxID=717944 RepID=UPI00046247D8|nr:uncharacterized protein TRAVEDRAFT_44614 [Trametes versicolor FP-101664 SS1]EIW61794.1 hypothetical protein TRAVEDRAFT_44614 [Trametes versicolor FP-101664 SS1]